MRLAVGKMIGSAGASFWGQVHDFMPEDVEKITSKGRLVAAVSLNIEEVMEQVEVVKVGREILSRLHELYFGSDEKSPLKALGAAIEKLREEFGQVSVASVVVVGEYGYVGVGGQAGVWVKTDTKQGFLAKTNVMDKVSVFSGRLKQGMVMVLGDGVFWENFPTVEMGNLTGLADKDMDGAVEIMTEKCSGKTPGGVATIVRVTEEEEEQQETIELPEETQAETEEERPKRSLPLGWLKKLSGVGNRIYIRHGDKDEQRKKMRYFGLGLVVLLLVITGLGQIVKRNNDTSSSQRETVILKVVTDFKDATAMAEVNSIKSRELLLQIKEDLKQFEEEKKPDTRVTEILGGWDAVWARAMGIVTAKQNELIDLTLLREGMEAGALAWSDGQLYALDTKGFRVVEIDIENGSGKVAAGGTSLAGARLLAGYPGKQMVMSDIGVIEAGVAEARIETDEITERVVGMEMFGGNVYLLDAEGGEIWRYAAKGDGFATEEEWLSEDEPRDGIKTGSDLAIDGSIWVVKLGGMEKFTRGVKDVFEVKYLDTGWGGKAKVFTNEEIDKVYILDPDNSRIVVINKQGEYLKQYKGDGWTGAKDLAVDEEKGKIFLGIGGKVWAVDL